jgi:acetyl-CoA decarbonylase/synthase complex subunit delta
MPLEIMKETWPGKIASLVIGASPQEGGTRKGHITVGGETTLPFLFQEGQIPNRPVIAMEILDIFPEDWPQTLKEPFKDVLANPVDWAKKCVQDYNAQILAVRLISIHPDYGARPQDEVLNFIESIRKAVEVPLIVTGCGDDERDNLILPKCSQALKGERCIIGEATQDNYKTLTASCLADGHSIIAQSPIDINIAKQLNILISEMGLELSRIAINPTVGALGYGLEYTYSIMERARLAALGGDNLLAMPLVCFVGQEAWRAKEAKSQAEEFPQWGDEKARGPLWEIVTAQTLLQAGADILIMRHPLAVEALRNAIDELMGNNQCNKKVNS